jgi:hypothetical protein
VAILPALDAAIAGFATLGDLPPMPADGELPIRSEPEMSDSNIPLLPRIDRPPVLVAFSPPCDLRSNIAFLPDFFI